MFIIFGKDGRIPFIRKNNKSRSPLNLVCSLPIYWSVVVQDLGLGDRETFAYLKSENRNTYTKIIRKSQLTRFTDNVTVRVLPIPIYKKLLVYLTYRKPLFYRRRLPKTKVMITKRLNKETKS